MRTMNISSRLKVWMFNRKAGSGKSMPGKIIEKLHLSAGDHVADIGSGGGYYSRRFAKIVGSKGMVYAVDINRQFLGYIAQKARKNRLNIVTVNGEISVPDGNLDLIFLRNAYHHLDNRVEYFRRLAPMLKGSGRLAIVEYKSSESSHVGHHVSREQIIDEMEKAGYIMDTGHDFLPHQSFLIFRPEASQSG